MYEVTYFLHSFRTNVPAPGGDVVSPDRQWCVLALSLAPLKPADGCVQAVFRLRSKGPGRAGLPKSHLLHRELRR